MPRLIGLAWCSGTEQAVYRRGVAGVFTLRAQAALRVMASVRLRATRAAWWRAGCKAGMSGARAQPA